MLASIQSILGTFANKPESYTEADNLITYTLDLISNPELTSRARVAFTKLKHLSVKDREIAYIPIYLELEDIIITHQPPIVKKEYTKDALRGEIKSSIRYQTFHTPLRLLFLKGSSYYINLFRVGIYGLVTYLVEHEGTARLRQIVAEATRGTLLESVCVEATGIDFSTVALGSQEITPQQVIVTFKTLYSALYNEICRTSGKVAGGDVVQKAFNFFRHHYDYETIFHYLKVLPEELLEHERIAFLSRQELQKKAEESVEEKNKREQAEKLARQYQQNVKEINDTKLALMNVIDDAKELEKTLKTERDRAQAIISSMAEGLVVIDEDRTVRLVNHAAEQILDIQASDMIGKNFSDIVRIYHADTEIPEHEKSLEEALTRGAIVVTSVDDDHYYHTKSGKQFPVSSTTAPLLSEGKVVGVVKLFRDATPEKESKLIIEETVKARTCELQEKNEALEKAKLQISEGWYNLQQEKARLTASIHNLSLGFILTDVTGNILIINPAAVNIFGNPQAPKNISDIDVMFQGINRTYYEKCVKERMLVEVKDFLYKNKYFHIFLTPILLSTEKGEENIGTVILIEDITEAKIVERSKDEFFSIASHELRTPLTAIRGNTAMIGEYYADKITDKSLQDIIHDIHESSVRLIEIVNDFLDLSRLELGKITFKKDLCDIAVITRSVISECETLASERRNKIDFVQPDHPLPRVVADADRIKQVLINLIGNAMKFTNDGTITISYEQKDSMVEIAVKDTGRGISPASQSLLFRKFQQAGQDLLTRDTTKGTGLGLYISKLLIDNMGGTIRLVSSEVGKGSVFAFTLPVAP